VQLTSDYTAPGLHVWDSTVLGSTLYFIASRAYHVGLDLWKSDGTPFGTVMVSAVNVVSYSLGTKSLTNVNGTLYFAANHGNGPEIWRSYDPRKNGRPSRLNRSDINRIAASKEHGGISH
jgi:ELWxxDGT repeat protein